MEYLEVARSRGTNKTRARLKRKRGGRFFGISRGPIRDAGPLDKGGEKCGGGAGDREGNCGGTDAHEFRLAYLAKVPQAVAGEIQPGPLMKLLSAARDDVAELIREPLWPI